MPDANDSGPGRSGIGGPLRIARILLLLASLIFSGTAIVSAQSSGAVDPSFLSGSFINGTVQTVVPLSGGALYIGGEFTSARGGSRNRVARLLDTGTVDPAFDPGTGANNEVESIVVQSDGKVIIGGWFTSYNGTSRPRIARLNANGSIDAGFDPGLGPNGIVNAVALQSDGKILIGGSFTSVNGVSRNGIARLLSNGSLDSTFDPGTGTAGGVLAIAVTSDGKVVIGGNFTSYDGVSTPYLARIASDGELDPAFLTTARPSATVSCLALQADGNLLVGGAFTQYGSTGRSRIARVLSNGTLDSSFDPGSGANGAVNAISIGGDGKVLIGGSFTSVGGTPRTYVARISSSGALDATFDPGTGAQSPVFAVAALSDQKSIVGGQFTRFDGVSLNFLVRLEDNGDIDPALNPGSGRNGAVTSVAYQSDGKPIVAGEFALVDGTPRAGLARLESDGSLDVTFDPGAGVDDRIDCIVVTTEGKIIIAGEFSTYDGVARAGVARLNVDGSLDLSFDPGTGADGPVTSLALNSDGTLMIGGDFSTYNGVARGRVARLLADGSLDSSFAPGSGADALVSSVAVQPDGKVLVAGDFLNFNGQSVGRIVRLSANGSADAAFNQAALADGLIQCVAIQPDGKVLIGGDFLTYGGISRPGIARLKADGSLDETFSPGSGVNGAVSTIGLLSDGKLIVGGTFSSVGGLTRQNLARISGDGSVDAGFGSEDGANGAVAALAISGDGKVLFGGEFTVYRGTACSYLLRAFGGPSLLSFVTNTPAKAVWSRGGSAPEVEQVTLEFSDDALAWTPLGSAVRVTGGWELDGLNLPKTGYLRARARAIGGLRNGSSSVIEQVSAYILPPEIAVEQPVGDGLTNGVSTISFGTIAFGGSSERTFTIRNVGYGDLSGVAVQLQGGDSGDFEVTAAPAAFLLPAEFTILTVRFDPVNAGSKSAVLRILSNDAPRSPFDVTISGVMQKGVQSITFGSIPPQMATASLDLSATGGASGNPVTFSVEGPAQLSGNTVTFTGPGTVTVTANQAGNANYDPAPPVQQSFSVTAVPAVVNLSGLSHVYDGNPKTATVTTIPADLPVSIDYGGPAPTNAGTHPVTATVSDLRYSGSASGDLVINKASQSISFAAIGNRIATEEVALSATGGGSGNPVIFTASGDAQVAGSLLTFTGPGTVIVRANQAQGPNHEAAPEVSQTIQVQAQAATIILSRLHQVTDGTARVPGVTTNPPDLVVNLTYDGSPTPPTGVGSYAISATFADPRYSGSATGTLEVDDSNRLLKVSGGTLPTLSALGELVVPTFQVGAYEVTWSHWSTVVAWAETNAGYDFEGSPSGIAGDHPVTRVNWYEAAKWCNARTEWENHQLGRALAPAYRVGGLVFRAGIPATPATVTCDFGTGGYRLPTAAEWEFAARGGVGETPSVYAGGDSIDGLGWYTGNSGGATRPAGGKLANELDLYDMTGNVAEWVWDAPSGTPAQRLLRGGAWSSSATACEIATLSGEIPATAFDRSGFRLARSVARSLAAALDDPALQWETSGDQLWSAETDVTHDGQDAAASGPHLQGETSWVETTVEGPGNVRFQWKTQGVAGQDVFTFSIDGPASRTRSGAADWEAVTAEIPEGTHLLRWSFARTSTSGAAEAWLDEVAYETVQPPVVTTAAATLVSGTAATLGGEVTDDGNREVSARGVVYSLNPDPTLASGVDLPDTVGGTGVISLPVTGLAEGTTYHARAYATNNRGTSYGNNVIFTTRTTVSLVSNVADYDRSILPGDHHYFDFSVSGTRLVSLISTGGATLRAILRDSGNVIIATFEGDADFDLEEALASGDYSLEIYRTDGTGPSQSYNIAFDASVEVLTRPDLAVGASPARLIGRNVFSTTGQSASLFSIKAKPVTAYAEFANRGNLPDRILARGSGGNGFFKVDYFTGAGKVTGDLLRGTFSTTEIDGTDAGVLVRAVVTPNKKKLAKKKGKKTKILKKPLTLSLKATSAFDAGIMDAATIKVQTK